MSDPLVACIILTKDRPEMANRAVESFRRQTYQRRTLIVIDTGAAADAYVYMGREGMVINERLFYNREARGLSIGALRNIANAQSNADILIHFDDDDWSHPNRITEQVALLQASGKQCVGYRDMLFWRVGLVHRAMQLQSKEGGWTKEALAYLGVSWPPPSGWLEELRERDGEAWLYTNQDPRYCLGTSLCYWRAAWEARPFPDISRGEDRKWLREIDSLGITSFPPFDGVPVKQWDFYDQAPRMIASIHSGNHVKYETTSAEWKRVPEWDAYCRERMAL